MTGAPSHVRAAQERAASQRPPTASWSSSATEWQTPAIGGYAGLATRAIAFALDAALVNGSALVVGVIVGLGLSILHLPEGADVAVAAIMGGAWVVWSVAYFAFFWSTTGQTPGDRVMRIQVIDGRGRGPLRPLRSTIRFAGIVVAAVPLLAGFLIMLWDDRRRCLQDRLARTLVVNVPDPGSASTLQVGRRQSPRRLR